MTKMTLEKAEKIMAKHRSDWFCHGLTDFQIARKLQYAHGGGALMMGYCANSILTKTHLAPPYLLLILISTISFLAYLVLISLRYASVCSLFERAAPQHLRELCVNASTINVGDHHQSPDPNQS